MQLNYHFLKRLVPELRKELDFAILAECFSQQKDELILGFSKPQGSDFYIRATLTSSFSCLSFPEDFKRSRKNSVNLFHRLIGQPVEEIYLFKNERAFSIHFDRDILTFKLHGNRSNIILHLHNGARVLFKNQLKGDQNPEQEASDRIIDRSLSLYQANPDFKAFYPTFGPIPALYLKEKGFHDLEVPAQWEMLQQLEQDMEQNPFYLLDLQGKPALSLLALGKAEPLGKSAIEATNRFFRTFTSNYYLSLEKKQVEAALSMRIRQTENYIKKSESRLEKLQHEIQPEQVADILMANLHKVPLRQKKVRLFNFYDNTELDIKLNPELSPQKNAEQYYRKSKNRKIEIEKTEANVFSKYEFLEKLRLQKRALEELKDIRSLRKWLKEQQLDQTAKEEARAPLPYKAFGISGYQVWVGKNARANDELSLKYAYKEDLWLHAKDVAGSHVLIKHQSGKNTPKEVIEKAAGLAAWYSKSKTESLAPVVVTTAKFVRKRKGSPHGQVIVSKENVVIVPPLSPENL